jgi:uncharacterized membrane protein
MGINKYEKIKKVFMTFFAVIAVISLILFKGGDTSLDSALAETMGPHQGQFLSIISPWLYLSSPLLCLLFIKDYSHRLFVRPQDRHNP